MEDTLADVARIDLDAPIMKQRALQNKHRERIRLLAGGTACAPDSQALCTCLHPGQVRKNFLAKCLKLLTFAKKIGLVNGNDVDQRGELLLSFLIVLQVIIIIPKTIELLSPHALLQAALHDELRIVGEINSRDVVNHVSKKPKYLIVQRDFLLVEIHLFPTEIGPLSDSNCERT